MVRSLCFTKVVVDAEKGAELELLGRAVSRFRPILCNKSRQLRHNLLHYKVLQKPSAQQTGASSVFFNPFRINILHLLARSDRTIRVEELENRSRTGWN